MNEIQKAILKNRLFWLCEVINNFEKSGGKTISLCAYNHFKEEREKYERRIAELGEG